ncbi:cytochrome b6/f subunit VI [Iris pallida]|uniref:Cytochrome b6/f subunit VI (Chloroplast) n=1 Tax=Iris pallida TaxID=29817 RepID=A0AAX6GSB3_IRIPA|nr:cytochrome b6/f subunit VI [Iris pallida]
MNCSFNSFQISRILFKPINRAGVIVEAANRKPK